MDDILLDTPPSYRHLGVVLSPNLKFDSHVSGIINTFRGRVFLLRHMSGLIPCSTLSLMYKCYVRPTVEYATPVWMFDLSSVCVNKLDKLQATAARAYLTSRNRNVPDWMTPKDDLNPLKAKPFYM